MDKSGQDTSATEQPAPKRKRGRPRSETRPTVWIGAHVTEIQRAEAHARAARARISVGAWILARCGL